MRTILLGIAFAVGCAATPPERLARPDPTSPAPTPQDGEAAYKKMEAALAAAKKLTVTFESTTDGATVKGTFKIDEGNKLEMAVQGAAGAKKYTLKVVCEGAQFTLERTEDPPPPVPLEAQPKLDAPANLTANVAAAMARGGAWFAQEFTEGEYRAIANAWFEERQKAKEENNRAMKPVSVAPRDATAIYTLENFRKGEGGASVTYDLVRKDGKPAVISSFSVWIDPKTSLPVKREGQFFVASPEGKTAGPAISKWVETYKAN